MASDDFTDSDGTALATHDAKWTASTLGITGAEINNNLVEHTANWQSVAAFYSDGQDEDQESVITFIGGVYSDRRHAGVRMTASRLGYGAGVGTLSGSDYITLSITKNGVWQAQTTGLSLPIANDHVVRITVSGNVNPEINAYLNGSSTPTVTWSDTSAVLTGGYPGFWTTESATVPLTRYDDWTDGIGGGGLGIPLVMNHRKILAGN